jgi:peptidoglycan hydrolase-like protein with peptidoglycan-binding domain
MRLSKPWPKEFSVNPNGKYGYRRHPITKKKTFHHGIDVAGVFPVLAAGDGVVRHIGFDKTGGGNVVGIEHGTNLWTFYYHGAERTALRNGQRVKVGEFIYTSGNTGSSTGSHLHFEVRKSSRWGNTVDPIPLFNSETALIVQPTGRENSATWRAWQNDLKKYGYTGLLDGVPGPMTYVAIQRYAGTPATGKFDNATKRAVQEKIGVIPDGVFGKGTWSEIQRRLNAGEM